MDGSLIRLITRAARAGAQLSLDHDRVRIRGLTDPDLLAQLRARRDEIATLLTGNCAACGEPPWIIEADTAIPWCRADARRRGMQLLRAERPDLIDERSAA